MHYYSHDKLYGYTAGEHYFPLSIGKLLFYESTDRGVEKTRETLAFLRELDV